VGGNLVKLARDFSVSVPPKRNKSREGVIELGAMAKLRNVVSSGNASLAAITAVTLNKNLSKDACISEWSAPELSCEKRDYAALDAWIALSIYDVLQNKQSASCLNQAISVFWNKQEVLSLINQRNSLWKERHQCQ